MEEDTKIINNNEEEEMNEAAGGGSENDGAGNNGGNSDKGGQEKTFTQQQVNRMMAKEKRQGRDAVMRELGIDPKDTKTFALIQSILKGTDVGKQGSSDDQKMAEMENRAKVAEAKAEAMKMGAQPAFVDDIVVLAMSKMKEDESTSLASAISEVKSKYANMFGKSGDEGNKDEKKDDDKSNENRSRGTGSSMKPKSASGGAKDGKNKSFGAQLAEQRRSRNSSKKSFWG